MKTHSPTSQEIDELVSFLPILYAEGFNPIIKWHGGSTGEDRGFVWPYPEYETVVKEFFKVAYNECWRDYKYRAEEARQMFEDEGAVESADLNQIKTMLTYCVRGERFCDGHWGKMITSGNIRRLLQRLAVLIGESG